MTEITDPQLAAYVAGRSTPDEAEAVRQWIAADASHAARARSLDATWRLGALPLDAWDADRAWSELQARRAERKLSIPWAAPAPAKRPSVGGWQAAGARWPLRVAAVLAVGLAGAGLWWAVPGFHRPRVTESRVHEYVTRPGQRAELRLADGTRVLLSVDSRIRVPAEFGEGAREIALEGEALFDVRHDEAHPFRVVTTRGAAEDLGTEFVVSAYPEDQDLHVAVLSGMVAFRPAGAADSAAAVHLTRGDVIELDASGAVQVRRGADLAPYVAWSEGDLVFESAPLREALPRIARWYDVDLRLADTALAGRRLTATFHDVPLSHVLDLLALSFPVNVERQGRTVVLVPKTGSHSK